MRPYDDKTATIYIGQSATPTIQVINLHEEASVASFGSKGKFIQKSPDSLETVSTHQYFIKHERQLMIESPVYEEIFIHNPTNNLLRFYRTAVEDTTVIDKKYEAALTYIKEEGIKGCPTTPSHQFLNQRKLYGLKPTYVQIYDLENKFELLADISIQMKAPHVIGYMDSRLYLISKYRPPKNNTSIVIYSYDLY